MRKEKIIIQKRGTRLSSGQEGAGVSITKLCGKPVIELTAQTYGRIFTQKIQIRDSIPSLKKAIKEYEKLYGVINEKD